MIGSMSFTQRIPAVVNAGRPLATPACAQTSFSLSGVSAASVVTLARTVFAGPVRFTGSGGSCCEAARLGTDSLRLSAEGLGVATATLRLPDAAGQYMRTGIHINALVHAPCTLNAFMVGNQQQSTYVEYK